MTVFRRKTKIKKADGTVTIRIATIYEYDFLFRGRRYRGSTEQLTPDAAQQVEDAIKKSTRLAAHGILPFDRTQTPRIAVFAAHYLAAQQARLERPDLVERSLRMVLAFWGAIPRQKAPVDGGVYHDLHLADPILDADWIVKFDDWMDARGLSGSTKNTYRSTMSGMYELALRPRWRKLTRISENPFRHIDRDRRRRRKVTLTLDDIRAWLQHADPHARLALAIGALAPKLRLHQILALRFDVHLDRELTRIRFRAHKTSRFYEDGDDQVTAVSDDLRAILQAVRQSHPGATYVVTYRRNRRRSARGKPLNSIKRACKSAAEAAGLRWGIAPGAVTFHALRHAIATEIARHGVSRLLHANALGHKDARTTEQFYTHLNVDDTRAVYNDVGTQLNITDLVIQDVGNDVGARSRKRAKTRRQTTTRSNATKAS